MWNWRSLINIFSKTKKEDKEGKQDTFINTNFDVIGENNIINNEDAMFEDTKFQIQGNNNCLDMKTSTFKNINLTILGNGNTVKIDAESLISNLTVFIRGDNHKLILGKCIINAGVFWYEDNNCKITIGKGTTIENAGLVVMEDYTEITIGEDCMFSHDITIRTSDSHSIIDNLTQERINPPQNVCIGNHVWIGAYCSILKGAFIGNDSIIGIHSIVNNSFANNTLIVGNPAKIVKHDITWNRERLKVN